jgi:hypothetical protein
MFFLKSCFPCFSHHCSFIVVETLKEGIASRDFVVCFLVSKDRSEVCTQAERIHVLLKFSFCVEFFDFRVLA